NEAEKLKLQVIETRKKRLGADHPSTLTSMADLASTYESASSFGVLFYQGRSWESSLKEGKHNLSPVYKKIVRRKVRCEL
ncbi:hypothetical protein AOQ84DRAFT_296474, partial [Glonium stellatum]